MEKKKINRNVTSNPFLFSFTIFLVFMLVIPQFATGQNNKTIPINVGVVLDMNSWIGQMGLSCISMALSDFYAVHSDYKTRIVPIIRDSQQDVVVAASAALDLLKNAEVQAILGPVSSMQADFIINLGMKAQVPIISFSATSPSLSSIRSPYFIRAALNDSSQVQALSSIIKTFGWREVVPIYVDNEFGDGIIPFITDAMDAINTRVPYRCAISPTATDDNIIAELYKVMTMQTRVFIVHMLPALGSRIFVKAKLLGMMSEEYAWIITDSITSELNSIDPSVLDSMEGVIGVRPYVPKTEELKNFTKRWRSNFHQKNPSILNPQLNVFGLWAYDSAMALAKAVEKAGVSRIGFQQLNTSGNSTDLDTFGVSTNGPILLQTLLNTSITGLSGDFDLFGRQLQSPRYQIVNVIAQGAKDVAFWTAEKGIFKNFHSIDISIQTNNKSNLSIIWPGDTVTPPKGWVIPTNGKKLRVGVPVKDGFTEFVKVVRNSDNTTTVTGYSIDVFKAVMSSLPYAVPLEYIPFETSDGKSAGTYNDLVYQVYLGNFDAVAGDTTIVANRSQYVDFTLPYTESGVSMVVPIRSNQSRNAWVFLKPLTWDLWLTSFLFFIVIGLLIWVLEHRINEEFRGPLLHQIGIIFWFSFSTMVFAHKEKIVSNPARFVLIIWFLVVFILTQSYTASLTSMLTVQQLQPTVTSTNELIKNKAYVGYQVGSFVYEMLIRMDFDKSRLVEYNSPDELQLLFTKGSENRVIAAAFDEIPFIKLFLARYCSQYTMIQPTYKTDGLGFVFPIGSPLVTDVSRAVLNVTESDIMNKIEKAWMLETANCQDSSTTLTSSNLNMGSFWGLFLIVGIAVFLAFIYYLTLFLYEHWHILTNPESSVWYKIAELARRFDNKDLSSHTFRKSDICIGAADDDGERTEISPHPNHLQSPVAFRLRKSPFSNLPPSQSLSNHSEHYGYEEQGNIPSLDNATFSIEGNPQETTPIVEFNVLHLTIGKLLEASNR